MGTSVKGEGWMKTTRFTQQENLRAYQEMKDELLKKYPGQFVAIYKGGLLAVNQDKSRLIREVRKEKGNITSLIMKVTEEFTQVRLPFTHV